MENEGIKTIYDELREYSEGRQVTFVEWAEFNQDEAPFNHLKINVTYADDDSRIYEFISCGKDEIITKLTSLYKGGVTKWRRVYDYFSIWYLLR